MRAWLKPDIRLSHFLTLLYGGFVSIGLIIFVNIGQPYLLIENLGMKSSEGTLTGTLAVVAEITALLSIGYIGVLADRIGRRPLIVFAAVVMGVGYFFMPLVTTIAALVVIRIILAVGTTAQTSMISTIVHDYSADNARGKMLASVGVLMGIGAVLMNVIVGNLPERFVAQGMDAITAGQYMHWIVVVLCMFSAIIFFFGFKPGTPVSAEERLPQLELIKRALAEARKPRIALAYTASFVSRSDLVILGTFIVLWGTVAGRDQGMDTAAAVASGVRLFAITQAAGLLCSPVLGYITDKINRVSGLAIGCLLGAVGYSSMWFVTDPGDPAFMPLFVLLGIGQTACNLSAQALIGQEAPAEARGVVIGGFGFAGTLGIIFSTWIGGVIFDLWMPSAPFVFVGGLTWIVFFYALGMRRVAPG
ncbi:MAG: MFS transporter [Gammaproteobacteria bacterium]